MFSCGYMSCLLVDNEKQYEMAEKIFSYEYNNKKKFILFTFLFFFRFFNLFSWECYKK